jgi:hypothetical protein
MFALILAGALVLAADDPPMPPEVGAAFEAWTDCITERIDHADRTQRAQAVADAALAGCQPLQDALLAAHRSWVESSALSDADKQAALRSMAESVETLRLSMVRMVTATRQ